MQFGIFYEHQLPRPWQEDSEARLIREALAQVELADRLGIDYAWEVEHHFLEEYSHSSAPEVFLAACAARTERIRLGHGIVLMPPGYNHPARVAERIAMLDLISGGRVEFGTGESASRTGGPTRARTPPPPMWLACSSRPMIHLAAQLGLGALTFAFVDVSEAKHWVADYYDTFKRECTPLGQAVNPNIAMVTGFSCHDDPAEAERRGLQGFQFFGFALAHYYLLGGHIPGRTNVWELFRGNQIPLPGGSGGIGTPDQVRDAMHQFEEAGVDQTVFIQQGGNNRHDDICAALELFAARVMPEFKERHAARQRRKAEELAPYVERALARRTPPREPGELPVVQAYGRDLAGGGGGVYPTTPDGRP